MTLSRCILGINEKRPSHGLRTSSLGARKTSKHVPSPLELPYLASRGPSVFLDKSGGGRDLPLPDISWKIEGPLLAG